MPLAGFEPAIPTVKWPQIYALDGTATGIGLMNKLNICGSVHHA